MSKDSKKSLSRRRFVALAGGLAATGLLVACGDNTATTGSSTTAASTGTTAAGAATTAAGTGTTAAAGAATSAATAAANLPPVELTFAYRATPLRDLELVQDELNKMLK